MYTLRAVVQLLILRGVPHFHPRDVEMLLVYDPLNTLGRRGLGSPNPHSALSSPWLCPDPFSWCSPLLQRVAQLGSFEGQDPFYKTVRNTSLSATTTSYCCKKVHFTKQLHKNSLSSWAGYIQPPLDVSHWSWQLQPVVQQRCRGAPHSSAELESRAGTFGDGVRLCFPVWRHMCYTLKCPVCMC